MEMVLVEEKAEGEEGVPVKEEVEGGVGKGGGAWKRSSKYESGEVVVSGGR